MQGTTDYSSNAGGRTGDINNRDGYYVNVANIVSTAPANVLSPILPRGTSLDIWATQRLIVG
jgi:hypothetical protein